jgi:peptide/nickel transport system permease protein
VGYYSAQHRKEIASAKLQPAAATLRRPKEATATIGYIIRRFFQAILVLLGTMLIVFVLFRLEGPEALARAILNTPKASQPQLQAIIKEYGFNLPPWDQLWRQIVNYAQLNFGRSPATNQSVLAEIKTALPRSLLLVGMSLVFAILVAIPLGVFQTVRRNKPSDYALTALSFIFYAMPAFLLGTLILLIFEDHWHIFTPISESESVGQIAGDWRQITPVVLTLAALTIAAFSRYMRSSMMDALTEDYVRTAKAKGAGQGRVLFRHAFRNALIPIITLVGLSLPAVAGGAVITEVVFNYPGMGNLTYNAAISSQVQVVVGTTVVFTLLTVTGSLLADILYAVADPRIRYAHR